MGRTALYRDPIPFSSAHAEVELDADTVLLRLPDGRTRRYPLHGCTALAIDGFVTATVDVTTQRRFVRMLVLERGAQREVLITPPEDGALAPSVVSVPEAPREAAILAPTAWETLVDWVTSGGRLAALAIVDLARLVTIATPQFALLIGEVAAQRALELAWVGRGPLRAGVELDIALQPLVHAARDSPRAAEALVSALAHAAGVTRRRRRR